VDDRGMIVGKGRRCLLYRHKTSSAAQPLFNGLLQFFLQE